MVVFYDFSCWFVDLRHAAFCGAFVPFVLWWVSWFGWETWLWVCVDCGAV